MEKKLIQKSAFIMGWLVAVLFFGTLLVKPQISYAYDVVTDIVKVEATEEGGDLNKIYEKYKTRHIIELASGTYTLSESLAIKTPVLIRAKAGLTADEVIIDGGAKAETASVDDEVWQAHLYLIAQALAGDGETIDRDWLIHLLPMALTKYPETETERGAKLWQWVRRDLLDLPENYQGEADDSDQNSNLPVEAPDYPNYKEIGLKGETPFDIRQSLVYERKQDYFNTNRTKMITAFEAAFDSDFSTTAFNHQLHMDNPYAMLEGVTLQHFMGFQSLTRDKKLAALSSASFDYYNELLPEQASAISINGSINRVKIVKNWMADYLVTDNFGIHDLRNGGRYGYGSYYEIGISCFKSFPSPIVSVDGGGVSNSLIAYNGYNYQYEGPDIYGKWGYTTWFKQKLSYHVGDYTAVAANGFSRFTNSTIANNNTQHNFISLGGDLLLQNNILLTLADVTEETSSYRSKAVRVYDGTYSADESQLAGSWRNPTNLNYATGGRYNEYYPPAFATDGAGLVNYEPNSNQENVHQWFKQVPAKTTGYRNPDGSSNEALTFDFTPKAEQLVDQGVDCYYPQIGLDANGASRLQGVKPDLGAYESAGEARNWQISGVTDDFYITVAGAGKKDGSSWENAYAGDSDIQYGIILAHRAGAKNVYVGSGEFQVHGKPYLYTGYANGFTTTIWDGIILAPVADSLINDPTQGMSLHGRLDGGDNPQTIFTGQVSSMLTSEIGTFPYTNPSNASPVNANPVYSWSSGSSSPSHSARTTYGTRVLSQVEPVKATVEGVVIQKGYVATMLPTNVTKSEWGFWTISEEIAGHNLAKGGGGVYLWNGTIKKSIIRNNYEARAFINRYTCGGGIFLNDGSVMEDTKVVGNYSETTGGGVLTAGSTVINRSLITGNVAFEDGGGIATGSQPLSKQRNNPTKILNTVISGNYALGLKWNAEASNFRAWKIEADYTKGRGGGILLNEASEVKHSTIANNFAPHGDNVYLAGGLLKNTAVYSTQYPQIFSMINGAIASGWNSGFSGSFASFYPMYLPDLPASPLSSNSGNAPSMAAQIFRYYLCANGQSIVYSHYTNQSITDIAVDQALYETDPALSSQLVNSAFRTMRTVGTSDGGLPPSSTQVAQPAAVGVNSQIYPHINALLAVGNPDGTGTPESVANVQPVSQYVLPYYQYIMNNASNGYSLPVAAQLAKKGVQDQDTLRDYFGLVRENQDIGAFASDYLENGVTIRYEKGTTRATTGLPEGCALVSGQSYQISSGQPDSGAGYVFTGWQADDAAKTVYQADETISSITRDTVLTAQWRAVHTVSYASGADDEAIELPENETVLDGDDYSISANAPSRAGYRFTGWQAGETTYQPNDRLENVTADVTLTAQWQAAYSVSYQAGTTDEIENLPATATVYLGDDYLISNKTPTREGHVFTGWRQAETETAYQPK
ncbi:MULTISPECIES: InlB B-repeat-containing protein, partial [unclassified Enterococcus]|uniref:InlB B-repeat-containing protein n=1 Tax=unclassified Enterococcus TaxID=2608891 RepID=UPI0015563AB5